MRRKTALVLLTAFTIGLSVLAAEEKNAAPKQQTHCPVMQRTPIDPALYVDVRGKRVYTCCKGCIAQVKGNPDKYIKRLEDQGVVLEKAPVISQTVCPVMGGAINKAQYADVKGKRIYVCCPGCIDKIKADPDKYIKQLEAEGITLDSTP
jgi:YHS domain-containing protein